MNSCLHQIFLDAPLATLALVLCSLCGCASSAGTAKGAPELLYSTNTPEPARIFRQTTANRYAVPFTAEGNKVIDGSYDQHYYLLEADQTKVDLPFLDSFGSPFSTGGQELYSKFFAIRHDSAWVAIGEELRAGRVKYSYDSGWYESDQWQKELSVKIIIRTFSRTALISGKRIEVCNPSNAANPKIQFDTSIPALRFASPEGTKIYLPMTDEIKMENPASRCATTKTAVRGWKSYSEPSTISTR